MDKKLYLISGFLGSGKTTLLKNLIALYADRRIAVIVNEFGKQGVDGALIAETGVKVDEISNGSIFCVCRSDMFVDVLARAMTSDAELVLVETSGLSDPTGIGQILNTVTEVTGRVFDFCGTITVVDCSRLLKLYQNVVAVKQQLLSAGLILINKTDVTDSEALEKTVELISEINPVARIYKTSFCEVKLRWMDDLRDTQRQIKGTVTRNTLGIKSLLVKLENRPEYERFFNWLNRISNEVYRIKGFVNLECGRYLVDCAGPGILIVPSKQPGSSHVVILLAGKDQTVRLIADSYRQIFGIDIAFE